MKVLRNTTNKDGSRTVTIRLQPGENTVIRDDGSIVCTAPKTTILLIREDRYYRLGGQVDEIMAPHVMAEAVPCFWCSIEQKWMDV